jgi:hypothetical protein
MAALAGLGRCGLHGRSWACVNDRRGRKAGGNSRSLDVVCAHVEDRRSSEWYVTRVVRTCAHDDVLHAKRT